MRGQGVTKREILRWWLRVSRSQSARWPADFRGIASNDYEIEVAMTLQLMVLVGTVLLFLFLRLCGSRSSFADSSICCARKVGGVQYHNQMPLFG